jgi:hypothetical protein
MQTGLTRRIVRYLFPGMAGITLALTLTGCEYFPESTFKLANESRPPKWVALPPGLPRANISISMSYYSDPWGRHATFVLQDKANRVLEKVKGNVACYGPFHLNNPRPGFAPGYPTYEFITVDGVSEMIEHRKMEPVFYISDDPAVWSQYRATGCR